MPAQDFWQQAWEEAQPRLDSIRSSLVALPSIRQQSLRIGQLDAELLDQELLQILKEPVNKALGLVSARWSSSLEPELNVILQLILYKYSIWESGATYGAKLQNLRYKAGRQSTNAHSGLPANLLFTHAALTVGLPYATKRIRVHALSNAWPDAPSFDRRKRAWDMLLAAESTHTTLSLLNFILFLWNGRYRTIADRLFGLRLVPVSNIMNRNVSYEFMNRQMVWHAFTEFLLFILPIVNTRILWRRISQSLNKFTWRLLLPPPLRPLSPSQTTEDSPKRGKYHRLAENECAICVEDAAADLSQLSTSASVSLPHLAAANASASIVTPSLAVDTAKPPSHPINNPYMTSCGHLYCYVCIAGRLFHASDEGEKYWECPRCDERVYHANRWDPVRHGRNRSMSISSTGGNVTRQRLGSVVSSEQALSQVRPGYGTSELDDSELSAMDLDSVSSIGLRTQSDFDNLSE